jgi:hypothetical protein
MPQNSAFVVTVSGLAILTAPPFRPQFFPATLLLSELFQITLVLSFLQCFIPAADSLKKAKGAGVNSIILYYRRFFDCLKYFFAGGQIMISSLFTSVFCIWCLVFSF